MLDNWVMVTANELVELRMIAQGFVTAPFATPAAAAAHLSASQGQHLGGVIASRALRTTSGARADVVSAFARGEIVRGYPMRGTVFAVAADDLAWQLALTGPRQLASAKRRRIEHGLDELVPQAAELARAAIAASPDRAITRAALGEAWEANDIPTDSGRLYHLVFTLMARGDVAYGPLRGSDHLLVDAHEWLPGSSSLEARFNSDERAALGHWLRAYLTGHGPATLRDFAWWTKLPLGRIRAAEAEATSELEAYGELEGETRWGRAGLREERERIGAETLAVGRLLPPFDELVLGYPDRHYIVPAEHHARLVPGNNGVFRPSAVRRGAILGTWSAKQRAAGREFLLESFAESVSEAARAEFARAFASYPHPEPDAAGE